MGRTIELRVSAAADASMRTVFKSFEQAAKQAQESVRRELGKTPVAARAAANAISKESAKEAREKERNLSYVARVRDRYFADQQRQEEKAARDRVRTEKRAADEVISTRRRMGTEARATFSRIQEASSRIKGEILSGMGIDMSLSGNISKSVSTQSNVLDATNSGMIAAGKTATPADVAASQKAVEEAGDANSISYGKMSEALKAYVERTGDLEEGKKMLAQMGVTANATGSDITDVATTMGTISKNLGDVPDKMQKMAELGRVIAQQGAAGSVEFRQLASEMPKIASKAFLFDGPREKMIGQLSALAQFAMVGGAKDASEASTSVASFANNFVKMKGKKQRQLEAEYGIDIASKRNEKGEAMSYKTPEELVVDTLKKTGGSPEALAKIFGDVRAGKAEMGLAQTFTHAGGGAAGEAAVREEFAKMAKGMSEEQEKAAAELKKSSAASKAEEFNNNLQKIASTLVSDVLPAVDKLMPKILEFLGAFEKVIAWAANNPAEAITAAIVGSIAKAAIGEAITGSIKGALSGGGGAGAMGGLLAGGLAIASAEIAITEAVLNAQKVAQDEGLKSTLEGGNDVSEAMALARKISSGQATPEDLQKATSMVGKLQGENAQNAQRVASGNWYQKFAEGGQLEGGRSWLEKKLDIPAITPGVENFLTNGSMGTSFAQQEAGKQNASNQGQIVQQMAEATNAMMQLTTALGGQRAKPTPVNVAVTVDSNNSTGRLTGVH